MESNWIICNVMISFYFEILKLKRINKTKKTKTNDNMETKQNNSTSMENWVRIKICFVNEYCRIFRMQNAEFIKKITELKILPSRSRDIILSIFNGSAIFYKFVNGFWIGSLLFFDDDLLLLSSFVCLNDEILILYILVEGWIKINYYYFFSKQPEKQKQNMFFLITDWLKQDDTTNYIV